MGKVFAYKNRILFVAIAVAVLASFLSLGVVAGSHTPVDGVTVGVSGSTSDSISSGVVTVTAKGSGGVFGIGASAKTTTITIYNSGAEKATVSFDWVATDVNSLKIDDTVMSEAKGTVSKLLEPDSSFTIIITTAKNATVNTLVMKNFARNEYKASNITVEFDSTLGSVTAGTQTLKNGETVTVTAATDFIANSSNFVAWVDNENNLLSYDKTLTINPEGSVTVKALFHKSAHFEVDNKVYSGLSAAILATSGATSKTIILLNSASLPAGEYTIPSGVTLLIPYDAKNTLCTTKPTLDGTTGFLSATANSWKTPTVFRKLTMESGAHITVNGAISLSGKMCFVQGSNGMPTGATSVISMESGSSITVNSGGNLYAWGYVIGNGEVTVESKGTVYENFQLRDWRGGDAVSKMLDKAEKVFPASQYYVQNIEVKMTLKAGAVENAYMALVASKCFADATVPFVGSNGMFRLTNGCLVKDYLEAEDRLQVDIDGDLSMSALVISAKTDLKNFDLNSAKYVLPITNNLYVNIVSGTTVISQDMAFLPGSELIIKENATVEVAKGVSVFVYDINEWAEKKYVFSDCDVSPLKFVGATWKAPKARPTMGDAKIEVNGTLDASLGYLFTTTGGANICSTGAGKVITTGAYKTDDKGNDITITYQYIQSSSSYDPVSIIPAKLKNGASSESEYINTNTNSETNTYYYCLAHEQWSTDNHEAVVTITQPTCQAQGSVVASCSTKSRTIETIAKVSHAWSEQSVNGNVYTCTCKYKCGADVVLNVEYRLDDYLWFNGYTGEGFYVNDGVTVSDNIQTIVANNIRYFIKAIPADEIPDELTFTATIKGGEATFTVSLKDYVVPASQENLKKALIAYGDAAKDYFEKTYKKEGSTGYQKPGYILIAPDAENTIMGFQPFGDVNIVTQGATIYFDEALRLAVKYRLSGVESNKVTINGSEYTIVQVGLLVKELTDWKMGDVLTTSTDGCTAYLAYNTANVKITSGGVENRPNSNLSGEAAANLKQFNLSGMITFDLKSEDYASGFALRTYVVLQDANGNYQCVYGKQYGYGLGAYINAMYNEDAAASAEDKSFNYLLEKVWALAQETAK